MNTASKSPSSFDGLPGNKFAARGKARLPFRSDNAHGTMVG